MQRDVAESRVAEAGILYVSSRVAPDFASRMMNKRSRGDLKSWRFRAKRVFVLEPPTGARFSTASFRANRSFQPRGSE